MLPRARLLIATFWVGMLWTVGFVVAPTLFATLADRALAGTIAGSLFRVAAWLSLVCAIVLFLLSLARRSEGESTRPLLYLIAGMAICTLLGYFCLQPYMASLREAMHAAASVDAAQLAEARKHFGILHGISTAFYVAQSLLGLGLVLKIR
jgi:hypothetical protein